jgi:hypothetical protein
MVIAPVHHLAGVTIGSVDYRIKENDTNIL